MIDWAKFLLGLVQLLGALVQYLNAKQLLDAGGQQAIAKILRAQADDLHKIQDAMADAGRRFDADGVRLPDDLKLRE
jgi:hypothetical protein